MKKLFSYLFLLIPVSVAAQSSDTISLESCYILAKEHQPLLQQNPLLEQQLDLTIRNLNSRYLPQVSFNARAGYQSDVTAIPFKLPGLHIPVISKDQYRAVIDLHQLIFDGGTLDRQKNIEQTANNLSVQKQDIFFHQLKEQLSDLYESALILQTNQQILALKEQTLRQQISQTEASVRNGTALPYKKDEMEAAMLELNQQQAILQSDRQTVVHSLSLMTGKKFNDSLHFILPAAPILREGKITNRPEWKQMEMQKNLVSQRISLLQTENVPTMSGFVQGGYGRPGLNMLSNRFEWFYSAGIQLNWTLFDWGYRRRQQQSLETDSRQIDLQKENFLLNTQIELDKQMQTLQLLQDNINKDQEIVALREKICHTSAAQLANGIITPTEYLIQLNDETTARVTQQTHIIQMVFAKLNYELLKNN